MEAAQEIVNDFPLSSWEGAQVRPQSRATPTPTFGTIIKAPSFKVIGDITINTEPPSSLPQVINPNIDVDKTNVGGRQLMNNRRLGATEKDILWPDGTVYYTFDSGVSSSVKNVIEDAMDHWKSNTCIKFVARSSQKDYVHFEEPSSGCSSAIGMDGGKQTIKLSQGCGFGAAVHEIMHALGFWHEQSRPDRDSFVDIHWENIESGKGHNFKRKGGSKIDSMGSRYDYDSIMHYGSTAFSTNGQATITPKVEGETIGQRSGLSDHDIWQAKKLYNCLSTCPSTHYTKKFYEGKAPFCAGSCPSDSEEIGRDKRGGGSYCWTGTKAYCQSCCKTEEENVYKWYGTAPFCSGECPSGWTYVKRDKRGDGARCWTGWKHQCKQMSSVETCQKPSKDYDPDCPPGGEIFYWFGTAPFCSGECPSGWTQQSTSNRGDGSRCWTGQKVLCKRSC